MRAWDVDTTERGLLKLTLRGRLTVEEMTAFVRAHNTAIDGFGTRDYKVLCDLRAMQPLSPDCAELFTRAKAYSDAHPNFRGSAVWVTSALVSMQHARTSKESGVATTELISSDYEALRAHLAQVWRDG